jgi:hypothetical protein
LSSRTPQPGQADRQARRDQDNAWSAEELARGLVATEIPNQPMVWSEFAVQQVKDNYLVCKFFDGTTAHDGTVNVAKDPELRHSNYDGRTIDGLEYEYTGAQARTVTKTSDSSTQDQIVIPKYHVPADGTGGFPGSIITAAPISTIVDDDEGDPIQCQWREITQRAFANVEAAS